MRFSKSIPGLGFLLSLVPAVSAAFGVTTSGNYFVVDCGSTNSLVFQVSKTSGDITSLVYRGVELQYASQGSHINSGLGTATVSASTSGSYVKITIATDTLTHYLIAKSGESNIYMATYITAQPSIGELRWIARLKSDVVPNADILAATTSGGTAIEGSDVFLVSGQTRSKFYSSERFIDDKVHCVYGDDTHVCMIMPGTAYEHSAGGPFMRDINYNNGGDYHALYWYMNSGHVPTEDRRIGLLGPYVMTFSRSGVPSATDFDTSFFKDLSIKGYVDVSGRGYVSGTTSGPASTYQRVLHWYNTGAQYWLAVGSTYTSPAMIPGTYTMKYYRNEFPIATTTVTVNAGATATANVVSNEPARTVVWSIGDLDGKPSGFRNADNQLRMHPSDSRMSSWGPLTYAVGGALTDFPMAQVKTVNDATTITFTLTAADAAAAANIRVATTLSFAGGRPSITINGKTSSAAAPTKIDSRGFTRGAYHGYGEVYDFGVAAGGLLTGSNTLTISCISGSTGTDFLNPNFIYDSVQLWR